MHVKTNEKSKHLKFLALLFKNYYLPAKKDNIQSTYKYSPCNNLETKEMLFIFYKEIKSVGNNRKIQKVVLDGTLE